MRSGEEIQAALRSFVARWQSYDGTKRAEAQDADEIVRRRLTRNREIVASQRAYDRLGTAPKIVHQTLDLTP